MPRTAGLDVADANDRRAVRHDQRSGLERQGHATVQGRQHERHDGLLHQRVGQPSGRVSGQQPAGARAHQRQHRTAVGQPPRDSGVLPPSQRRRADSRVAYQRTAVFQSAANRRAESSGDAAVLCPCVTSNQACNWGRYYTLQRIGIAYHNEFAPNQFFEIIPYFSISLSTIDLPDDPAGKQQRRRRVPLRQLERAVRKEQLLRRRVPAAVRQSTAAALREHQRQHRGADAKLQREDHLLRRLCGRCLRRHQGLHDRDPGGRWDYTGRQATVDNFGPAGNPFNPNTPTLPDRYAETAAAFRRHQSEGRFCLSHDADLAVIGSTPARPMRAPLNVRALSSVNANGSANTGFLNLDAQRAWQLELGHRGTTADKRYSWDVTVYNLEMQKEILASNINNQGTFQNANGTRHTGVEAGGATVLKKGLFAQGVPART
ncbi:MAG: TonB-dependent receptor [Nitrospiraceae bacterium]